MVYKSVDHQKLWSIFFYNNIYFYEKPKTKQPAVRDMLRHFHGLFSHRPQLSPNQRARIRSIIIKTPLEYKPHRLWAPLKPLMKLYKAIAYKWSFTAYGLVDFSSNAISSTMFL